MDLTIRAAIAAAAQTLAEISATPRLDAELLMAHALGAGRDAMLLAMLDKPAPAGFDALIARRQRHEPVAYITGSRDFWTLELKVSPDVLVPRPDSETLVEAAIDLLPARPGLRFLDLGTGSGALLLAALDHWREGWGLGIDRSAAAAAMAAANARNLKLQDRAAFVTGDWANAVAGRFDGIFCNPPYIASEEALPRDVADYEPASALYAGPEGLDDYRRIIPALPDLLVSGGYAFMEIGADQAKAVCQLGRQAGLATRVRRDLAGHDRCVILCR